MASLIGIGFRARRASSTIFAVTVFSSAGLVFLVEPMAAKMILPYLGGSPSVWNTSLAFFQAALLLGYAYAHVLQKLRSVRRQQLIHLACLAIAALTLPLRVNHGLGDPSSQSPNLWLLGELCLALGAPFTLLSATAPLLQAWLVRQDRGINEPAADVYPLYAASNLGSLIALLAYPAIVEPLASLAQQRYGWSVGFVAFTLLIAFIHFTEKFSDATGASVQLPSAATKPSKLTVLRWILLAAAPSSLMLGVTTHLTTDIGSFPFLWAAPLALYLTAVGVLP